MRLFNFDGTRVPKHQCRVVSVYCEGNEWLEMTPYQLPNTNDCIEKLGEKKFFELVLTNETKCIVNLVSRRLIGAEPCQAKFHPSDKT